MPPIIYKTQIEKLISEAKLETLLQYIEHAFVTYSSEQAVVPPVGTLTFQSPPGDVHIKYGYIKDDPIYVIKIASGFYENPSLGLSSSNGLNLVFNQKTGILQTILLDEGYLTDVRTALAGAVVAKYLAPPKVEQIGIIGSGIQARLQLRYLKEVVDCKQVIVCGRSMEKLLAYQEEMNQEGFDISITTDSEQVAEKCQLIVTTTPATSPLLHTAKLQKGVLITAMGADTEGKQELDMDILEMADLIVMDSRSQCRSHGEIHKAFQRHLLAESKMMELGEMIASGEVNRKASDTIVADLTGIATQDIQISRFILDHL